MIYIKKYIINQTPSFEKELESIYKYLAFKLKEPLVAKNFYNKLIKEIYSLQYFPKRYMRIFSYKNRNRNIRRFLINQYIIVYEINVNTRSSFHITYFPQ